MSASRVRFAAWAVPIACFALSAALIAERQIAFTTAVRRAHGLDADLNRAYVDAAALNGLKKESRFAVAPRNAREESVFFTGLRRHAALANVAIVRLRSQSETLGTDHVQSGPAASDPASVEAVTKGVTNISCQLVLDGRYPALRRFLRGLSTADRLYTIGDVSWSRAKNGTELAFTLHRYLAPAGSSKEAPNS